MAVSTQKEGADLEPSIQQLSREHYENFPLASWLLPGGLREHIRCLYAYARTTDDIGDEARGDRVRRLDEWEADLRRCFDGSPQNSLLQELQKTIEEHDLPAEPFVRLIEANRRDQRVKRYETWEEMLDYCTYSANPCGRLYLMVCGYRDEELFELSDYTCTALQLTNFWQDVGIDLGKDRIYIPLELLEKYNISAEDLYQWNQEERAPVRFVDLMDELVERTSAYFAKGVELVSRVRTRLRFDILLFTLGGNATLRALKKSRYPVFQERVKLEGLSRWMIFPRALWVVLTGGVDRVKEKIVIES